MKQILIALSISVAAAPALAHTVKMPDGSTWQHDETDSYFTEGPVRNVSATEPQVTDCDKATWPDIPAKCIVTDIASGEPQSQG